MSDPLSAELRALGRSLDTPPPAELTAAVMERVLAEPPPALPSRVARTRAWLSRRWRAVAGAVTAVVLVGALTPPVRAAVAQWLGFGAVEVRVGSGAPPSSAPPPGAVVGVPQAEARRLARIPVLVPAALGEPPSVEVSADGMAVSMSWRDGAIRLDQIAGTLSPYYLKTVYHQIEFTTVHGAEALWLKSPHHVVVERSSGEHTQPPRLAGATLIWQSGGVTLRLEGELTRAEAVAIAES